MNRSVIVVTGSQISRRVKLYNDLFVGQLKGSTSIQMENEQRRQLERLLAPEQLVKINDKPGEAPVGEQKSISLSAINSLAGSDGRDEARIDVAQMRLSSAQRQSATGIRKVNRMRSLLIGSVAVAGLLSLLVLAQQTLKFPMAAAAMGKSQETGVNSVSSLTAKFSVNNNIAPLTTKNLGESGNSANTSGGSCNSGSSSGSSSSKGCNLGAVTVRSSRFVEQQRANLGGHLHSFLSSGSGAGSGEILEDELRWAKIGHANSNYRKQPAINTNARVLNLVSDPSIDIVPTAHEYDLAPEASEANSAIIGFETRKKISLDKQLIPLKVSVAPLDETITIDKIKGIDLEPTIRTMAKKEASEEAGTGQPLLGQANEQCRISKFDRLIEQKMRTNSLSRSIVKPDGRFDNPFSTWHNVGPLDIMKFVITESDESNIPKKRQELDKELPILKPNFEVDPSKKQDFRLTWIGHATTLIQVDDLNILTDPVFSDRASPIQLFGPRRYREPACHVDELPRIDAVVISHNHYDHLDANSVKEINDRFGSNCRWIVPLGIGEFLQSMSVKNYVELDWWQKDCFQVGDIQPNANSNTSISQLSEQTTNAVVSSSRSQPTQTNKDSTDFVASSQLDIYLTPNQHWSRRGVNDVCKSLWGSYTIVSSTGSTFFFGGDTGYCSAFKEIKEVFGPMTGAAIPIGAYQPRWFMKFSHVDPHEAVQIHRDLSSSKSISIHHSTFALANEYYKEPPRLLREIMANLSTKDPTFTQPFITLKHGESTEFCKSTC